MPFRIHEFIIEELIEEHAGYDNFLIRRVAEANGRAKTLKVIDHTVYFRFKLVNIHYRNSYQNIFRLA